jgi:hypothetical protein
LRSARGPCSLASMIPFTPQSPPTSVYAHGISLHYITPPPSPFPLWGLALSRSGVVPAGGGRLCHPVQLLPRLPPAGAGRAAGCGAWVDKRDRSKGDAWVRGGGGVPMDPNRELHGSTPGAACGTEGTLKGSAAGSAQGSLQDGAYLGMCGLRELHTAAPPAACHLGKGKGLSSRRIDTIRINLLTRPTPRPGHSTPTRSRLSIPPPPFAHSCWRERPAAASLRFGRSQAHSRCRCTPRLRASAGSGSAGRSRCWRGCCCWWWSWQCPCRQRAKRCEMWLWDAAESCTAGGRT